MNKLKLTLPIIALAGLATSGVAFAKNSTITPKVATPITMSAMSTCYPDNPSDVCVQNVSGETMYVTIPQMDYYSFPVYETGPYSMKVLPYYQEAYSDGYPSIHVLIENGNGVVQFDQYVPNHGPVIQLDPPLKTDKTKAVVKLL